jgi:hypothetical protein
MCGAVLVGATENSATTQALTSSTLRVPRSERVHCVNALWMGGRSASFPKKVLRMRFYRIPSRDNLVCGQNGLYRAGYTTFI